MRGIKGAFLLGGFAIIIWTVVNLGIEAMAIFPDWKWWHVGAAGACLYVVLDLLDRWREFLGWRGGERRRRYAPWRRYE